MLIFFLLTSVWDEILSFSLLSQYKWWLPIFKYKIPPMKLKRQHAWWLKACTDHRVRWIWIWIPVLWVRIPNYMFFESSLNLFLLPWNRLIGTCFIGTVRNKKKKNACKNSYLAQCLTCNKHSAGGYEDQNDDHQIINL